MRNNSTYWTIGCSSMIISFIIGLVLVFSSSDEEIGAIGIIGACLIYIPILTGIVLGFIGIWLYNRFIFYMIWCGFAVIGLVIGLCVIGGIAAGIGLLFLAGLLALLHFVVLPYQKEIVTIGGIPFVLFFAIGALAFSILFFIGVM